MTEAGPSDTNWFDSGGEAYRRGRPSMPARVARRLAEACAHHGLAIDVGCGSGQLTVSLLGRFDRVVGIDPSRSQLDAAPSHPNLTFFEGRESALPVATGSADFIVACQAAHWFDMAAFESECRRVARSQALISIVGYGVPEIEGPARELLSAFYWRDIHAFWPAARASIERRYTDLNLELEPIEIGELPPFIELCWSVDQLAAYVRTWSACRKAQAEGQGDRQHRFESELAAHWSDKAHHAIRWPIFAKAWKLPG